jgi:hypothetical protein
LVRTNMYCRIILLMLIIPGISIAAAIDSKHQPSRSAEIAPIFDGPRNSLVGSAMRVWLLDRGSNICSSSWPTPRSNWNQADLSPVISWYSSTLSATSGVNMNLGNLRNDDFELAGGLKLSLRNWTFQSNVNSNEGELSDEANGIDLELGLFSKFACWLHFRDAALNGDLPLSETAGFAERKKWIWTEYQQDSNSLSHDETTAGMAYTHKIGKSSQLYLAFIKDQIRWGSGLLRAGQISGDQAAAVPHFQLVLDSKPLRLISLVGELYSGLSEQFNVYENPAGNSKTPLRQKWIVAHRLEYTNTNLALGFGEAVILGDRRPGPGYLNPLNFLWSEQHAEGDKDNTILFADLRLRLPRFIPGAWMSYADLSIDDYTLADFGKELEGQKYSSLIGLSGCPFPVVDSKDAMRIGDFELPGISWLTFELSKVRPYFGSHFYSINTYQQSSSTLGLLPEPNSKNSEWELRHELRIPDFDILKLRNSALLLFRIRGGKLQHGQNYWLNDELVNVGGSIEQPHRDSIDQQSAEFLAGSKYTQAYLSLGLEIKNLLKWENSSGSEFTVGTFSLRIDWSNFDNDSQNPDMIDSRDHDLEIWLDWGSTF